MRGLGGIIYGRRTYETTQYWDEVDAGDLEVAGPELAGSLTSLGLIDEYRLYVHPVVLGTGNAFFAGPRPRLRLEASDQMGNDVIRLTYVPA